MCQAPRDVEGRIIGIVVMLFGIGFLSVLTATIASHFSQSDTSSDQPRLPCSSNGCSGWKSRVETAAKRRR